MEAEATVSGMEKVKQGGRGGFFASWTSFERAVVGGMLRGRLLFFFRIEIEFFFSIRLLSSID